MSHTVPTRVQPGNFSNLLGWISSSNIPLPPPPTSRVSSVGERMDADAGPPADGGGVAAAQRRRPRCSELGADAMRRVTTILSLQAPSPPPQKMLYPWVMEPRKFILFALDLAEVKRPALRTMSAASLDRYYRPQVKVTPQEISPVFIAWEPPLKFEKKKLMNGEEYTSTSKIKGVRNSQHSAVCNT